MNLKSYDLVELPNGQVMTFEQFAKLLIRKIRLFGKDALNKEIELKEVVK